ncbi:MAG TPA: 2-amino-4-hydroxy-6-hydroxymethyldihydropteridine diphosphokinase [Gammaproteobacteria bacterium]|nr:2-amino-4-hydroxy-6-hydroxymethyldihydropteridine diphosphokinase [Gammaproteobacteria bacterium]
MANVYLSIGSNIQRATNISNGISALKKQFPSLQCSPVYESVAVGFSGDNFYNLVAHFSTSQSIAAVCRILTEIEDQNGRNRNTPKFSARTLDLDLLLYDEQIITSDKLTLPRPEIYTNAFVLRPLADIAGHLVDPIKKQTYEQLWKAFKSASQKLWKIALPLEDL